MSNPLAFALNGFAGLAVLCAWSRKIARHVRTKALWTASALIMVATANVAHAATVVAPTFTPAAGTYTTTQTVTIATTTSGASIRYTTDGSTPSATVGTLYSTPVSIAV